MEMYGSLIFDYCTETVVVQSDLDSCGKENEKKKRRRKTQNRTQPSRRSVRIMTRQNVEPNEDLAQETTSDVPQEKPTKRKGRKLKSKQTLNKNKFPPKDKEISIIQPSKVAASMRKIPEKILHINYETKEILIKWKHLTTPEYLDRSKSISPDVLALILEYKPNLDSNTDTQDIPEIKKIAQKTASSISEYRREQRFAMPENFKHVTRHIKTE